MTYMIVEIYITASRGKALIEELNWMLSCQIHTDPEW